MRIRFTERIRRGARLGPLPFLLLLAGAASALHCGAEPPAQQGIQERRGAALGASLRPQQVLDHSPGGTESCSSTSFERKDA